MLIKIIQENGVDVDSLIDKWNNEVEMENRQNEGGDTDNTKSVDIEIVIRFIYLFYYYNMIFLFSKKMIIVLNFIFLSMQKFIYLEKVKSIIFNLFNT